MKSKFNFIFLASTLFLFSCASNQSKSKPSHHHHTCSMENCKMNNKGEMYSKKCALSVSHGDFHKEGKDEYMLTHEGHNYYFSSEDKKKEFSRNIEKNIEMANSNWQIYERSNNR